MGLDVRRVLKALVSNQNAEPATAGEGSAVSYATLTLKSIEEAQVVYPGELPSDGEVRLQTIYCQHF